MRFSIGVKKSDSVFKIQYYSLFFSFFWIQMILFIACSSFKRNPLLFDSGEPHEKKPLSPLKINAIHGVEGFGPLAKEFSYGPEPQSVRPIVLVLGPGLARGFAYSGVFRALEESKISIAAILGTEMGGLIGALYAMNANINQFEWELLNIKEELFQKKQGFLNRHFNSPFNRSHEELFQLALQKIFNQKNLSEFKIPFYVAVQEKNSKRVQVLNQGNAAKILRCAMANPKVFNPCIENESNLEWISTELARPFLVNEAHALQLGPVIVVHTIDHKKLTSFMPDELKLADLVIPLVMKDVDDMDFDKKIDAAFYGKTSMLKSIPEIQHLQ